MKKVDFEKKQWTCIRKKTLPFFQKWQAGND